MTDFTGVQPPHPGAQFDSTVGWEWAQRITKFLVGIPKLDDDNVFTGKNTFTGSVAINGGITFSGGLGVNDDVLLKLSNTTNAGAIYRKVPNTVGFADGATDLFTVNRTSKDGVIGGNFTLNGIQLFFGGTSAYILYNIFTLQLQFNVLGTTWMSVGGSGMVVTPSLKALSTLTMPDNTRFDMSGGAGSSYMFHNPGLGRWELHSSAGIVFGYTDGGEPFFAAFLASTATAGAAAALPATPQGYMQVTLLGGGEARIPFYNV